MRIFLCLCIPLLMVGCNSPIEKKEETPSNFTPASEQPKENRAAIVPQDTVSVESKSTFHLETTYDPAVGWGYDIFEGKNLRIHQPHIPAVQGNRGFTSAENAKKVAEKVIEKLDKGIMPPTISIAEMQELGVL